MVLDASVALTWLLADSKPGDRNYAQRVLESLSGEEFGAVVPAIWPFEITNVIAKAEAKALLTEAQSEAFLELLAELDIEIDGSSLTKAPTSILQLARRYKLSSYDASYLELAMRMSLPLATLDSDLQKAANKAGVAKFRQGAHE
jgi:predicted nucleic acid-binding protein